MSKATDIHCLATELYFLPVRTRVPLKFGAEVLSEVTCARVLMTVADGDGRTAVGWGETPLSVQWAWPANLPYEARHRAMKDFCVRLAKAWAGFGSSGHPVEVGHDFLEQELPRLLPEQGTMPLLAGLICSSPFDLALHDAFGRLHQRPVYETYGPEFMSRMLADFLESPDFTGKYINDLLLPKRSEKLPAWHLVGGLDPLEPSDLTGKEPNDGFPILLRDWIARDGLKCLKIKLRGNDAAWDYERLVRVGNIGREMGADKLSADFNCTVTDPAYVTEILDRLQKDEREIFGSILYVEQPFPYDLEKHRIDVHEVSSRKPLFLDESAHDWRMIRLGRELGWNGVALKTCKTQTGALLSACWAKARGMQLMVQDLTNPMLAQIPHVLLAAHVGTIQGVETNAMQFYPEASNYEAAVHPGLYQRRDGMIDLSTIQGPGFGYRVDQIKRPLPEAHFRS